MFKEGYISKLKGNDLSASKDIEYGKMNEKELPRIFDEEDKKYVVFGFDFILFYLPYHKCKQFVDIVNSRFGDVLYLYDAQDDILLDRIQTDGLYDCEKKLLTDYIKDNLSVDFVLDKINESGINSLTELEKNYLKSLN